MKWFPVNNFAYRERLIYSAYLSPAPQAEPQAAGFSSGLSPAPQAEPQAAGFSSGLSPAPQAEPQAAGFSSGLSPAPQAEPQAAGFSSGLSPAPQAEPQAEATTSSFFFAQPNRLESAIMITSIFYFWNISCSLTILYLTSIKEKSTHLFIT